MQAIDPDARAAAKLANDGVLELYELRGRDSTRIHELEARVDDLEDAARPSRIDPDFEGRVLRLLESRLTSSPPDSSAEVKTAGGNRVRAPVWSAIVIALIVLAIVAVWQGPDWIVALQAKH